MNKAFVLYKAAVVTLLLGKTTDEEIANKLESNNPQDIAIVRELYPVIKNLWITGAERVERIEVIFKQHKIPLRENWIKGLNN